MPATLRLERQTPGVLVELRRGIFDILLDGSRIGSIASGDTVEQPVEPGHHTLRIRHGRYSSRAHSFDASDGDEVTFRCSGALIWPLWVASFIKPDLGIWLRRE